MRILLAVSGGIDSMYMLNMASGLFPGASFAVAHCNFGLRGEESDADEALVRGRCAELGLECIAKRFTTESYASQHGISIEMAARELRYAWFAQVCREEGFDAVAVAHNAGDNAETLLLNLLRGAGTRGLRGMAERSTTAEGLTVLRPMLHIARAEIKAVMEQNGWCWREDRTNSENIYKRNILRNEVFPILERINPSVLKTLNEDMGRIAQVDDIAQTYFEECGISADAGEISLEALLALKHWKYVLYRLLSPLGLDEDSLDNLTEAIELSRSGQQLAGKVFGPVVCTNSSLIIKNGETAADRYSLEILPVSELESLKQPEGVLVMDAAKLAAACGCEVGELPSKMVVRKWREGDWMRPLGLRGRKKLSDMFVDLKFNPVQKEKAMVIQTMDDHSKVAALLFCRISEEVKVDASTTTVLRLKKD